MQLMIYYGRKSSGVCASHDERQCISLLKGPGVGPGGEISWNDRMLIPMDTVPSIYNCIIIRLSYVLIVEAMTEAGNLSVEVPIVIGTRPFQGE